MLYAQHKCINLSIFKKIWFKYIFGPYFCYFYSIWFLFSFCVQLDLHFHQIVVNLTISTNVFKQLTFLNSICHVSAPGFLIFFLIFFNFFNLLKFFLKKFKICLIFFLFQKNCPRVSASVTCQFVIIYIFCLIQSLYSLFLFNLVPIFVKINQFCPFQIDIKFNIFYKNYINIFSKIDI